MEESIGPLSAPEPVRATEGKYRDAVELCWTEVRGAAGYAVYRSESDDSEYLLIDVCSSGICELTNSSAFQGAFPVNPGSIYTYSVAAVDTQGNEGSRSSAVPGWAYQSATPEDLIIEFTYDLVDTGSLLPGDVSQFSLILDFYGNGMLTVCIVDTETVYQFSAPLPDVDRIFQFLCEADLFRDDGTSVNWPIKKIPNNDSICTTASGVVFSIPPNINAPEVLALILQAKDLLTQLLPVELSQILA